VRGIPFVVNNFKRGVMAYERKMMDEITRCFIYEPEGECRGASGRKLRQVCVYCPMYSRYLKQKREKEKKDEENR